jgi:ABC-2 type transport system permease protein
MWRVMYGAAGSSTVSGVSLSGFLVTGVFGSILLSSSIWTSGYALEWERDEGTSGSLFLSPASRSAVIAGYGLGSFVWFLPSVLVLVLLSLVTGATFDLSPLAAALGAIALAVSSLSMGFAFASLFILSRRGNLIANVMQPPLLLFAGFAVPLSRLPASVQWISNALPITHALEAFRPAVLNGAGMGTVGYQLSLAFGVSTAFVLVGVISLHRMEHVARGLGQLDLY